MLFILMTPSHFHNLFLKLTLVFCSEPYAPSATRPPATAGDCDGLDCSVISPQPKSSLVWVVGPVVAGIGLALLVVLVIVFR